MSFENGLSLTHVVLQNEGYVFLCGENYSKNHDAVRPVTYFPIETLRTQNMKDAFKQN